MNYDVIILGGGVIGAGCAFELSKAGLKVLVLEKRHISSGASGSSAAMLEFQIDAHRGDPFFTLSKTSLQLFPSLRDEIKDLTGVDFQYDPCGIVQLALNEEEARWLKNEVARQKEFGLRAEWLGDEALQDKIPYLNPIHLGGAFYEEDGQVNGELLTSSLIKAAQLKGATITADCGETSFIITNNRVVGIKTPSQDYSGEKILLATGAWTDEVLKPLGIQLGVYPVRGQLVIYNTPNNFLIFPIYTKKSGYVTPKRDGYTLAGTTVEEVGFDESVTEEGREKIIKMVCELLPNFAKKSVRGMSAGLRPGSPDGLPILGQLFEHPNLFVASGHYRNGILLAPITAQIVRGLILGKKPLIDISYFSPDRTRQ